MPNKIEKWYARKEFNPHTSPTGMYTFGGKLGGFDPLNPDPDLVDIRAIANGLGRICRYGGQCVPFISVAMHSMWVAIRVPKQDRLAALLHDAPEAYLGDQIRPLKHCMYIKMPNGEMLEIEEVHERLRVVIFARFGLPTEMPPSIGPVDNDGNTQKDIEELISLDITGYPSPHEQARDWLRYVEMELNHAEQD